MSRLHSRSVAVDERVAPVPAADPGGARRITLHPWIGLIAWFIAVAAYGLWPLPAHLGDRVPHNLADPLENAWIFSWAAWAIVHQPLDFFQANIFNPEPFTFAYTENMSGLSLVAAPIYWLTGNALLQVNVATLLALASSGLGMYVLVKGATGRGVVAFVAGTAYTILPYRMGQFAHPHMLVHLLPWIAAMLLSLSRDVRRWKVITLGVLVAWQFWSSLTGGLISLLLVFGWGVWELLQRRRRALPVLAWTAVAMALAGALTFPVVRPYLELRRVHPEFQHGSSQMVYYSATPQSYLYPPDEGGPTGPLYDYLRDAFEDRVAPWEKTLWPGLALAFGMPAAVAAAAAAALRRRRSSPWLAPFSFGLLLGIVGFVLTLGPRLGARPDGIPLPFAALSKLVPGGLMRAPARFGSLVMLGLVFAAAVALAALPAKRRNVLAAVALALVLVEGAATIPMRRPPALTAAHERLDERPGVTLFLPMTEIDASGEVRSASQTVEAQHLYLTTKGFAPIINGYAAFFPSSYFAVAAAVQQFPSTEGFRVLGQRDVRTVVVQTETVRRTPWAGVDDRLERWPGVRLIEADRGVRIYDVTRAAKAAASEPAAGGERPKAEASRQ